MSKIMQAVNIMIDFRDKITDARKGQFTNEYFFSYNYKYVWSILKNEDFIVSNYPVPKDTTPGSYISQLSILNPEEFERIDFIYYSTRDLKTREAKESFSELYTIVKEKILGIDEILDDIINNSDPPPEKRTPQLGGNLGVFKCQGTSVL